MYERGLRSPGVALLSRLLAAAGCQLKVELEPLGADIDTAVRRALATPPRERADRLAYGLVDLAAELADAPYVVTGLAAAVLQGAPVEPTDVEVWIGDDDATLQRLCRWLTGRAMRVWDNESPGWVWVKPNPTMLRTFTPMRWADNLDDEYVLTLADGATIRPDVQVPVGGAVIPVAGL